MEVGAQGGAVAAHEDGAAAHRIAQEIAGGEMGVERQVWAEEGEGAGGDEIGMGLGAEGLGPSRLARP